VEGIHVYVTNCTMIHILLFYMLSEIDGLNETTQVYQILSLT
jgi:hypothetical protein